MSQAIQGNAVAAVHMGQLEIFFHVACHSVAEIRFGWCRHERGGAQELQDLHHPRVHFGKEIARGVQRAA